jgi:hypothetical protein
MSTTRATAVVLAGAALGLPAAADARPPARVLLRAPLDHQASLVAHRRSTRAITLRERTVALKRALDRANGDKVRVRAERRRAHRAAVPTLRHRVHVLHTKLAAARTPAATASAPLQAIAACESGGNPATDTGNGFYGKYQFTRQTWASVGGTGNPAAASEAEQDARAAQLYAQQGSSPWPVCGR